MSAVATHVKKIQMSAAACTIAAAAVLTPAAVAAAKPDLIPTAPVTHMLATGPVQFAQDVPWWWVGDAPNPHVSLAFGPLPLPGTTILSFQPLSLIPGFLKPLAGWFLGFIPPVSVCVAGLGVEVGAYGTVSVRSGAC
jgi:hypothetical protein